MTTPSDPPPPPDAAVTPAPTTTPAAPTPTRTRREKWRRRFFVLVTLIVMIGLGFRALLHVLFPAVLDRVARSYGLTAQYDKLDLSVLGADVGLWGLRFTPISGGKPVISTSYCRGAISTLALLEFKLHVQRVEAEDAEVLVERLPDGSLPLLERLLSSTAAKPTSTPTTPSKAVSLDAPLTIDALRLQNARAHLRDAMMTPATDVTLQMDLLVRDVGSVDRKTRVELQLNSPETLAALYVNADGMSRDNQVDANLSVKMVGLDLLPARAYLEPFGIVPRSQDISATAKGTLHASLAKATPATRTQSTSRPTTAPAAGTLQASLALDDIVLTADAVEAASVRSLHIDARELSPGAIRLDRIAVAGVHANGMRTEQGLLRFAGIEISGAESQSIPTTRPTSKSAKSVASSPLPIFEVDRFDVSDVDLAFADAAMQPASAFSFSVSQLLIEHFSTDLTRTDRPATLTIAAAAPNIARQISVTGEISSSAPVKTAAIKVAINGITADAIAPYLRPLGIDESFDDGAFTCTINGQFETRGDGTSHATLNVADLNLTDGSHEVAAMPRVGVGDASFDPAKNKIRFDDIELVGPTLPIRRDADGTIRLLGLHTLATPLAASPTASAPATMPATARAVASAAPPADASAGVPTIEIGKLAWHGSNITLDDRATGGAPLDLVLNDVGAEIHDLTLASHGDAKPGRLTFSLRAPGVVETYDVNGTVSPTADSLAFDVRADSTGISFDRLRPLLASFGIEPTLKAGVFHLDANGNVRNVGGVYRTDLALKQAQFSDADTQWLGVGSSAIRGAVFDGKRLHIAAVEVDSPHAIVGRDEAGRLTVAGVKLLTPKTPSRVDGSGPAAPTQIDLSLPIVGKIDSVIVKNAMLNFKDDAVLPAGDLSAIVDVNMNGIVVGADAPEASYSLRVASPGVVDRLDINGGFKLSPHEQSFTASIAGNGLGGRAIETYLPPTIGVDMAGRTVAATVSASLKPNPAGGSSGAFTLNHASIKSADGNTVDAGMTSLRAKLERVDLPGKVIAIDEVAVEGVKFGATQDAAGMHAVGVTVSPTPLRATRPAPLAAEPVAGAQASDVSRLVRESNESLPLIKLNRLTLGADRLSLRTPALAEPLVISKAELINNGEPIVFGGATPADNPPIHLQASLGIDGLIDTLQADAKLAPFATDPSAEMAVAASGIDGTGLTRLVPSLDALLNGQDLKDARFATAADAHFKFARRGPIGIDLTRDIIADFAVKGTKLTVPNEERPLIAVDEVRGDKIRYSPANGSLVVGSLDISKPIASVVRDKDGVHVAGITLKFLQPTTQPASQPTTGEVVLQHDAVAAPAPIAVTPTASEGAKPASDVRIDRLTVSGVDFNIEDRVNTPHSVIPVSDLDVEVVGLSTRALTEARPVRFSAVVSAGKVPLPPRKLKVGVESEDREVFAEASTNGNLTLFPKPSGYVRASISGLELTAVRGIASEYGLTLGGGTFDGRLDVRMKSGDTFEAKVWPTFNELRMKEIPDGPIQSTFRLPAPPDVIISTLEDVDGSLTFPFTVPIEAGKLDTGAVIGSAVGSVGKVLAEAMVAAPLKAGKLMGALVGLDMTSGRVRGLEPVTLEFAAGESQLTSEQIAALGRIRDLMRGDPTIEVTLQHELGSDDVALADERVNLGVDDSRALAELLLARKRELQRRYADGSADLSVTMATQDASRVEAAETRLRDTATQLKLTEDGLDTVFDLLRPGADRQASRRGKAAAILLADLRLRGVQDWFLGTNVRDAADRVRRSNALYNPLDSGAGRVRIVLTRRAKS